MASHGASQSLVEGDWRCPAGALLERLIIDHRVFDHPGGCGHHPSSHSDHSTDL
jgi:hypothetical protein